MTPYSGQIWRQGWVLDTSGISWFHSQSEFTCRVLPFWDTFLVLSLLGKSFICHMPNNMPLLLCFLPDSQDSCSSSDLTFISLFYKCHSLLLDWLKTEFPLSPTCCHLAQSPVEQDLDNNWIIYLSPLLGLCVNILTLPKRRSRIWRARSRNVLVTGSNWSGRGQVGQGIPRKQQLSVAASACLRSRSEPPPSGSPCNACILRGFCDWY